MIAIMSPAYTRPRFGKPSRTLSHTSRHDDVGAMIFEDAVMLALVGSQM